jgi:polyisoprenoid-binding protein YceI
VLGDTLAASAPIQATPLTLASATAAPAATQPLAPSATPQPETGADPTPTSPAASPTTVPEGGLAIYTISQADSQVSFTIYEELRGAPNDVIGVTDQVAGEVAVDPNDLSTVQLGTIQVNARTLVTDDDRRNQAIRNIILNTDQYELITFTPTAIVSLSGAGQVGQVYTFKIEGNLTIRDITQPVVFTAEVTAGEDGRLTGTASAEITRAAYKILIPDVPFVANVADNVTLKIDFVAVKQ